MNVKTTLILFLLVVGLGGAVWWQSERERSGTFELVVPLFEGVDRDRITALRLDHIERGVQLKLERDELGVWYMTDPVEDRADLSVLRLLLDAVTRNQMVVLSEVEAEMARPGFEPPRAHFEVTEQLDAGRRRTLLLELGETDIDGQNVFVRRDGKLYKTQRNIDNTLLRGAMDFRDKHMLVADPRKVRGLRRTGAMRDGDGTVDLSLDAFRSGIEWRLREPRVVAADNRVIDNYLTALVSQRAKRFVSEGQFALKRFGLHIPDIRFELVMADGSSSALLVSRPSEESGAWFAKLEDEETVWEVESSVVMRLALPASSMLQLEALQIASGMAEEVELKGAEAHLRLSRLDERRWTVSERRDGEWRVDLPADSEQVEAILARIEAAKVSRYLLDVDPAEAFEPGTPWLAVQQQGQPLRLHFGGLFRSEEGSEAMQVWRDGDEVVALVAPELGELVRLRRSQLLRRNVFELDEVRLGGLELEHDGVTRRFLRSRAGMWEYPDLGSEAVELRPVLDRLFFLRASSHLDEPAGSLPPLEEPVELRIRGNDREDSVARIGLGSEDGVTYIEHLGTRSIAEFQDLHGQLVEIVERKQPTGSGG